jgi:regulator of protease activity HflC (stomatin/prohibitin superfamily)
MNQKGDGEMAILIIIIILVLSIITFFVFGPQYSVWQQGLQGQAELARAEYNKQVAVEEARATLESSKLLAQAEIERAKGVAGANEIIGDSLKGNEEYLRYLYIDQLKNSNNQIIYVPTEASLPILEATRGK